MNMNTWTHEHELTSFCFTAAPETLTLFVLCPTGSSERYLHRRCSLSTTHVLNDTQSPDSPDPLSELHLTQSTWTLTVVTLNSIFNWPELTVQLQTPHPGHLDILWNRKLTLLQDSDWLGAAVSQQDSWSRLCSAPTNLSSNTDRGAVVLLRCTAASGLHHTGLQVAF